VEGHGRHQRTGRRFGIGVVGLGEGKALVKGLAGHPDLPVVAVCDTDETRREAARRLYGVPYAYADLGAMLGRGDVDIVAIYTPDELHLEHLSAALAAGKHVICTKPLVRSVAEARCVLDLARAHPDRKLMVGQSSRFFGPMQAQRRAVVEGRLGEVFYAEAGYVHDLRWFYENRPWALGGGLDLVFGGCSHPVDLVRWYLGDVAEVHAYADRTTVAKEAGFGGEDLFVVNLRFESGRVGRVLGFYGLEQPHQTRPWIEVAVYGPRGTWIARYPQLESTVKLAGKPERIEHYFEDTYHYFQFEGVNHHAGEFVNYTEYFARCLVDGVSPEPGPEDGFKTIAALEAIRKSVESGRPECPEAVA
jgi:predicted dehydrogenase